MFHELYNPYSPESQDSPQGPYQPPSAQVDPGNVGKPSHLVVGSAPSREVMDHYRLSTPISQGQFSRYSKIMPSGASSWPSSYQTTSSEACSNVYHATSSSSLSSPNIPPSHYSQSPKPYPVSHYLSGGCDDNVGNNKPSTREADSASAASSVDRKHPSSSKNTDGNQATYTCDSAMGILKRFNLQEEDLDELCAYSEDQLSPANLPYLLRDIHQKKEKMSSAASQLSVVHQALGSQHVEEAPLVFLQPSRVIEYGHTSKSTVSFRNEEDRVRESGSMDSYISPRRETQPKNAALAKHSGPVFSNGSQRSTTLSPAYSPLPSLMDLLIHRPAAPSIQTAVTAAKKGPVVLQSAAPAATNAIPKRDSSAHCVASPGTSQGPASGIRTTGHKPAPGPGSTRHRPAPGTGPGSVPSPNSSPMNQAPPPASDTSIQRPPPAKAAGKSVPTAAMVNDYMGFTPKLFPHTCCLCNKPCVGVKDWLDHRNHIVHLAGCRLLRKQYSEWEPDTVTLDPAPEESQQLLATTSRFSLQAPCHGGPAPSNSASPLPSKSYETHKCRSPQRRWSRSPQRKRSRSPQRKRSRSPQRKRSRLPGGLRSPDRKRPSRKAGSPRGSRNIFSRRSRSRSRSSSRSSSSSHHYHGRRRRSGSPQRGQGSRYARPSQCSPPRSSRQTHRPRSGSPSPHLSSQRRRSRSCDRRSSGRRQEETGVERLAKKLLESSGVQTFSGSTSLEVVVQSLAPVLLAELAKLKSSSSSSTSSKDPKKPSSSRDENKPSSSSSRDEQKQSSSSRDEMKPPSSFPSRDEQKSFSSSSRDEQKQASSSLPTEKKKPSSSSPAREEQKQASSSSPTEEKKPSSSSSARDEQKQASSSSSRDEQKQASSSSPKDEKKPSSSSSARDEQKQASSSSPRDEKKLSSSSSARDEQKKSLSSPPTEEKKPSSSSSSRDEQKQASTSLAKGGKGPPSSSSSSSTQGPKKAAVKRVLTKAMKTQGSGLLGFIPAHPPLLLSGLPSTVTQAQVLAAVEQFGKSRLISVAQHGQEATVYFLQAGAAQALLGFTELNIGGNPITVTQKAVPRKTTLPQLMSLLFNQGSAQAKGQPTNRGSVSISPTLGPAGKVQSVATMAATVVAKPSSSSMPGDKKAAPGNTTATPGYMGSTPGNTATITGNKTTMPGNKKAQPSNTTPRDTTTTPGKKNMAANKAPTSGKSTTMPGKKKATLGKKTAPPGNKTATSANTTARPLKKTTSSDSTMTTPGNKAATPSNKTGQPSKTMATPGNKTGQPSKTMATPGNKTATPGNKTATPGNKTATPDNKAATPSNKTAQPSKTMATPGNKTAQPSKTMATPGNKTATPGNKTAQPSKTMATPGNKTAQPSKTMATPGNKTATPGNKTAQPSKTMATPGNKTATPGNKAATPDNKAAQPTKTMATPSKKMAPGNTTMPIKKTTSPSNTTATPGNTTTTPGNTATTPDNKTTTSGNKTVTPGNITTRPDDKTVNNTDKPGNKWTKPLHSASPPRSFAKILPTILFLKSIKCTDVRSWTLADFQPCATRGATIMVTDLPENVREPNMIGVLEKFGNIECDKYFILPDNRTAFVAVVGNKMEQLMEALAKGASMCPHVVHCHLLEENVLGSPIAFYQHLLKWSEKAYDKTSLEYRLVYMSNVPTDEDYWMEALRDGITKTGGVRVYLPLMGKIFVEFVTTEDADRFGVWLSSFRPKLKLENQIQVIRPGIVPDMEAISPVHTNIGHKPFLKGLQPPFWLVVPTLPHLYPTLSPQFYTPAHRTVSGPEDVEWADRNCPGQTVVMVTGLPLGGYSHMALMVEVWPYFAEKDVCRVFYNVLILPLQRRAFIYFEDSSRCKRFVSDFVHKPLTIGGCDLTLHFLLECPSTSTTEQHMYKQMLRWSNVVPEESVNLGLLLLTEMKHCSMRALKTIFTSMENTSYISCIVLANRVVFQICRGQSQSHKRWMDDLLTNLNMENDNAVDGTQWFPKPQRFQWASRFMSDMCTINLRTLFSYQHQATQPTPRSPAPSPSGAARPTHALTPAAPVDPGAPAPNPAGLLCPGPQPPVLSQEMYRFFATAIRQHRQARVGQELSRAGQEVSPVKEVPEELHKTTSSSASRGVETNSSVTARSSSLSEATVSSSPDLPKSSSSSSSLHPPVGVVHSSSEQNTPQKKCRESPAPVSEAVNTTHPPSPPSQEVTTMEKVESLPTCQPITKDKSQRKAATVYQGDMARLGHKMVVETSAVKSAASLTEKETLHTDPSLEEERKRQAFEAQQELTLPGKDMLISSTEDPNENRVEVDGTHQQMGDGQTSDHMLHSRPEPKLENQTLVQSDQTPGLPDPKSKTLKPQEDEMLANVTDEAEPVQVDPEDKDTVLEEEKMTAVEEQMPSATEEIPTVVSDAAVSILNDASTKKDDTHQPMDRVEGSPPEEESNEEPTEEEQSNKEEQSAKAPTEVEQSNDEMQRNKDELNGRKPAEKEQTNKEPTEKEQTNKEPTEKEQRNKKPTEKEQTNKEPTEKEQTNKEPTEKEQTNKEPTEEGKNIKEQSSNALAEAEMAPELEQHRSKRGHPSPVTKPPSTRRSPRYSLPTKTRECPAGDPVEVEEADYQILDSVEEDTSSPRGGVSPPSGALNPQGEPHPEEDEGEYQVVDSVEGEAAEDKRVQLPTRKRGRPPKWTREKSTAPVRAGQKPNEPLKNQGCPTKAESKHQGAPEPTYHIVDSIEGEPNTEEPTNTDEKWRGKEDGAEGSQTAIKVTPCNAKPRVSSEGVSLEEVATYQVLDSVEEEELEVKDVPPVSRATRGRGKKGRAAQKAGNPPTGKDYKQSLEGAMFEVLDSIGGDAVEEAPATEQPGRPRQGLAKKESMPARVGKIKHDDTPGGRHTKQDQGRKEEEEGVVRPAVGSEKQELQGEEQTAAGKRRSGRWKKEEVPVSVTSKRAAKEGQQRVQDQEEEVYQVVDSVEDKPHEEEHANSPGPRRRSSRRRDPAPTKTRSTRTPAKSTQREEPQYQVVDCVGGEEEQVPEVTLRGKRGGKVTGSDAKTDEKATKKKETREQTIALQRQQDVGEKQETDAGESRSRASESNVLVSLEEVSEEEEDYPDDQVEEELRKRQAVAEEEKRCEEEEEERKLGAEMEGLVTLDEVGEDELGEEEEQGEEVGRGGEDQSGGREGGITERELQALLTLDEIVEEEVEGEGPTFSVPLPPLPDNQSEARVHTEMLCDEEKLSSSVAGKRKQSEEQAEEGVSFVTLDEVGYEEEEETQTHSKRARQTTVRSPTRGEQQLPPKPSGQEALPTTLQATSLLASQPGLALSDRGAEPMAASPARDREETEVEEHRIGRKASCKARRVTEEAEPKRVRSLSPSVADGYTLPPFTPHNPLGVDHVVPKAGFYCNLCSVFYEDETRARTLHCSSLGHYHNLKKYYQRLQGEQSRSQSGGFAPEDAPKRL